MKLLAYFRNGNRVDWPKILLLSLAVTVGIVLVVGSAISLAPFNPYNPTWEGTNEFRTTLEDDPETELQFARNTALYDDLDAEDTAMVFAPSESYNETSIASMKGFVERGGTLVVFDNFGPHGNDLLEDLGIELRFNGEVLRDEQYYDRGPTMPIAIGVEEHPLTVGVDSLTLNYATALEANEESVIVRTSNVTYLGAEEHEIGDDDELSAYPVVAVETIGAGQVVGVGDPSIAVNEMVARTGNERFLVNLAAGERVVIDVSHGSNIPPLRIGLLAIQTIPIVAGTVGLLCVVAIAILGQRPLRRPRVPRTVKWVVPGGMLDNTDGPQLGADTRRRFLESRHPEWDTERIDRIVKAFNRHSTEFAEEHDR